MVEAPSEREVGKGEGELVHRAVEVVAKRDVRKRLGEVVDGLVKVRAEVEMGEGRR